MHCILAASHAWDRGVYDAIRKVYNSVGHVGCRPCPPFEEWGGIRELCDHIFCRYVVRICRVVACAPCFIRGTNRAFAVAGRYVHGSCSAGIVTEPPRLLHLCMWTFCP